MPGVPAALAGSLRVYVLESETVFGRQLCSHGSDVANNLAILYVSKQGTV
jgi:hypothetical protein